MRVLTIVCGVVLAVAVDASVERRLLVAVPPASAGCGGAGVRGLCAGVWKFAPRAELRAACGSCVPQTCNYMPSVVYRALYQPAVVTAYQPVVGCNACSGCAVSLPAGVSLGISRQLGALHHVHAGLLGRARGCLRGLHSMHQLQSVQRLQSMHQLQFVRQL